MSRLTTPKRHGRLVDFLSANFFAIPVNEMTSVRPGLTHDTLLSHEAAAEKDEHGLLPLHRAAANQTPLEVVLALLKVHEAGAKEKDNEYGNLPLHLAASNEAPLEVVLALLKVHEAGAAEKDKDGNLPLHRAAANQAPLEVVLALLGANKAGAKEKDKEGRLPLHYAAVNQAPSEVMLALLEVHKAGAAEKDKDGRLPLHYAAKNKASLEVLALLLLASPDGAREKEFMKNKLPVHLAAEVSNWEAIDCLLVLFLPNGVPSAPGSDAGIFRSRELVPVGRSGVSCFEGRIDFLLQFLKDLYSAASVATFECVVTNVIQMCALQERSLAESEISEEAKPALLAGLNSLRFLARSLSYKRTDIVASLHLHLCGDGCSGKTTLRSVLQQTLRHWSSLGFTTSYTRWLHEWTAKAIGLIDGRTVGMEVEHVQHNGFKFIICDYGGQEEFRVNHSRFLDRPDSVFVVVVPLWDVLAKDAKGKQRGAPMDFNTIMDRYRYWLRFINSSCAAPVKRCLTVINFREKLLNSHPGGPAKARKLLEDVERAIMREQDEWWEAEGFMFPGYEDAVTRKRCHSPVQALDVNKSRDVWNHIKPQESLGARDDCITPSPIPQCVCTVIDILSAQALHRQKLADAARNHGGVFGQMLRATFKAPLKSPSDAPWPLTESEADFKSRIRSALVASWTAGSSADGPATSASTPMPTPENLHLIPDEATVEYLTDLTFARLVELQEVASLGGHVVTDLQWLTSKALGALVNHYNKTSKRSGGNMRDVAFLLSDDVINDVTGECAAELFGAGKSVVCVPHLLESIGACIPVDDVSGTVDDVSGTRRWFPAFLGSGKVLREGDKSALREGDGGDLTFFGKVDEFLKEARGSNARVCLRRFRLERAGRQHFSAGYFNRLFVAVFRMHKPCTIVLQDHVGYENAIDLKKDKGNDSQKNGRLRLIIMHSAAVSSTESNGSETSILMAVLTKDLLLRAALEEIAALSDKIRLDQGPVRVCEYCIDPESLTERLSTEVIRGMQDADEDGKADLSAYLFGRDGNDNAVSDVPDLVAFLASRFEATDRRLAELQRSADGNRRLLDSIDSRLEARLEGTLERLDGLAASFARSDLYLGVRISALVRGVEYLQNAAVGSAELQRQHGESLENIVSMLQHSDAEGLAGIKDKLDAALEGINALASEAVETRELVRVLEFNDNLMPYSFIIVDKAMRRHLSKVPGYAFLASRLDAADGNGMIEGISRGFKRGCSAAKSVVVEQLRVLFICPVTFRIMPCGAEGNGYHLEVPRAKESKMLRAFVAVADVLIAVALKTGSSGIITVPSLSALLNVPEMNPLTQATIHQHLSAVPQGPSRESYSLENWLTAVLGAVNDEHLKLGAVFQAVAAAEGYSGSGDWGGPLLTGLVKRPVAGGRSRWVSVEGWEMLDGN